MSTTVSFIGFGEAGQAFARPGVRAFDRKTADPDAREAMVAAYSANGVIGVETAAAALDGADAAISLVTADQALSAARTCAPLVTRGMLWIDMNSVAPGTKRAAATAIEDAGGRYVDAAVMSPVLPARLDAPLLVAGPHAEAAEQLLRAHGFTSIARSGACVGDASAVKMIRSVMVKGIEALSAECAIAAHRAGVRDAVFASLDADGRAGDWEARVDYGLGRMLAHGLRRAAEMEEAAATLEELGVDPTMTGGTIRRQRALGMLGLAPPDGLAAKLAAIGERR